MPHPAPRGPLLVVFFNSRGRRGRASRRRTDTRQQNARARRLPQDAPLAPPDALAASGRRAGQDDARSH